MKHMILITLTILIAILLVTHELWAQPPGMPGSPDQSPIDGGLWFLAALGGAYALKKLKESESKK